MNDPHILGTERIGKLLVQYSIPAIIGMTITSLYNIIDSIFIGHGVGAMGIAGLAITFPLMNLVVAFCTLVSAGGSAISSIRLGQKDMDGAAEVLDNTLMLCLVNAHSCFGGHRLSSSWMRSCVSSVPATTPCPMRGTFMQVILAGNSHYLYDDRAEQCDARHRLSQESHADLNGYGGLQHHTGPYLYLPL